MHQFNASPLPMVWLLNGFAMSERAGRSLVRYERLHDLLGALHKAVVLKPALLNSAEIVYLRRSLDLLQSELAAIVGCTEQTLSLWERGAHPIPRSSDTLLRKHCIEEAAAIFGRSAPAHRVSNLSRLAELSADYLYEGSFSGREWSFAHRPTRTARATQQVTGVAAMPSTGTFVKDSQRICSEATAVVNAQMTLTDGASASGATGTWRQPLTLGKQFGSAMVNSNG